MISYYLVNILFFAVAIFFLVYFMLCSSCKEIENILSIFSKKKRLKHQHKKYFTMKMKTMCKYL